MRTVLFQRLRSLRRVLALTTEPVLWEALFWTVGYLLVQGLVLVGFLALLLTSAYGLRWPGQAELIAFALELEWDRSFLLIGATCLGAVFVVIPLVRWREGRDFRRRLGWGAPTRDHAIYALATVTPIAVLGDLAYALAVRSMTGAELLWPMAAALQETSLELLHSTLQGVSYPVLVVALALGPAVAEELVFRGVLGRRLIGRFGVVRGVLLTSLCFALAHGSWPHALATLPVAVLLHVVYLRTGTIWAPMLVHFGNNLVAVTTARFNLELTAPDPLAALLLGAYLLGILWLWRVRLTSPRMAL